MQAEKRTSGFGMFVRKHAQLLIPIIFLTILLLINVIRNPSFFEIGTIVNNDGNTSLSGYPIMILNQATELVIIVLGMTLVTSASGGQDISVGALAAIAGATFYRILTMGNMEDPGTVLLAFLACCLVTMFFGAFNGVLVSVFRIQPMIATLILFSCGRSIAYWIGSEPNATFESGLVSKLAVNFPGVVIPTPILICLAVGIIFFCLTKFTNLGLYAQSVGINQGASKLNGISPTRVKLLVFIILGACCAVSGFIRTSRLGLISYEKQLQDIEMDAILAVAIGGNSLGGGKYSLVGSVLGAYTIQTLSTTLDGFNIKSTDIKAYKAIVIILLVVIGSQTVKKQITRLFNRIRSNPGAHAQDEAAPNGQQPEKGVE